MAKCEEGSTDSEPLPWFFSHSLWAKAQSTSSATISSDATITAVVTTVGIELMRLVIRLLLVQYTSPLVAH